MNTPMTTADEVHFLREWAGDNKAYFEDEGECGFGRECVGIIKDGCYPYYRAHRSLRVAPYIEETHYCPEAEPPEGVEDAYHKTDCLAVLGRGPGAIHQLYLWVKHLADQGIGIEVQQRTPADMLDLAFHGAVEPVLVKRPS